MLGANNQGWPHCGEIDIMENIGKFEDQGTCHGSLHGPGYSGGHCLGGQYVLPNGDRFKNGYHIFAVLWEKDSVQFYCDGHLYETRTPRDLPAGNEGWVYNHPFFLILNFAVGGNWPGDPDDTTKFPQQMLVDYVRVYSRNPPSKKPKLAAMQGQP
jgi:beta-glucanase (GH16 family)